MYGADIALKYSVSEARFREFLAEAERQRMVDLAIETKPVARRVASVEVRARLATILLRAGSWLMPDDRRDDRCQPGTGTLELRLGR